MDHQETPWFEVMTFNSSSAGKKTKANKKSHNGSTSDQMGPTHSLMYGSAFQRPQKLSGFAR